MLLIHVYQPECSWYVPNYSSRYVAEIVGNKALLKIA